MTSQDCALVDQVSVRKISPHFANLLHVTNISHIYFLVLVNTFAKIPQ